MAELEQIKTSKRLTFDDAKDIWLRHWSGEFQHDIASHFHVNQGRVKEVLKGRRHAGSEQAAAFLRESI
jgi:hypothetical protein